MSAQLDFSVGIGKESTYGTAVTPTDFPESEAKMKYDVKTATSNGNRLGKHVTRTNRNTVTRYEGSGEVAFDAATKGLGVWLEAVLKDAEIPLLDCFRLAQKRGGNTGWSALVKQAFPPTTMPPEHADELNWWRLGLP